MEKLDATLNRESVFSKLLKDDASILSLARRLLQFPAEDFVRWRWQMKHQAQDEKEMEAFFRLSPWEKDGFQDTASLFQAGVTPYYAALIASLPEEKRSTLTRQVIPLSQEKEDPLGVMDPLEEQAHSPVKEVVHLYPDRVAFCVAQICPVYCRYCYRKRRDEETGLHFHREILRRGLEYIASMPKIRDVLITGGDPFLASDEALVSLLEKLRQIPHVEVIRFGTRTPVALPYRLTPELAQKLAQFHPLYVHTHFNSVHEVTPDAVLGISHLLQAGIPVNNQTVLLRGVNDSVEEMRALCWALAKNRIRPYYLFHPHLVHGSAHLRPTVQEGLRIMKGLRGRISGYAIPTYVMDTPSGKIPLTPQHQLGIDGSDLILEDLNGAIWRERGAETQA